MKLLTVIAALIIFSCQQSSKVMALNPNFILLEKGKTAQITAKVGVKAVLATWVSGTTTVATVNSTGVVTGVACGTSTITATSGSLQAQAVVSAYVPLGIQAVDGTGTVVQPTSVVNGVPQYQTKVGQTLQLQTTGGCP